MPAVEQTWRNNKLLHVIFGVSSLALLGATLWMLVADHNRPWKPYAMTMRKAEVRLLEMQQAQRQTERFTAELKRLNDRLAQAEGAPVPAEAIQAFADAAEQMTKQPAEGEDPLLRQFDRAKLEELNAAVTAAAKEGNLENAKKARTRLIEAMQAIIKRAKFAEGQLAASKKKNGALRDAARSEYSLSVRDNRPAAVQEKLLAEAQRLDALTTKFDQQATEAKAQRQKLDDYLRQATAPIDDAKKLVDVHQAEITQLQKTEHDREPRFSRSILEAPILDAFNGPLKPAQIWLPDLKIKYPLNEVARFDRCTTCHAGMDKTLPGTASTAAFPHESLFTVELTPKKTDEAGKELAADNITLASVYGIHMAHEGLINAEEATVVVWPQSRAAKAGLQTADVISRVDGVKINNQQDARRYLLDTVVWDKPLKVEIRRGVPHPYSAHPRLDLIGSDSSPHPFGKVGCTICHDGQGTATAFQYAEHTPSSVADRERWIRDRGWYSNHYWDWPQKPLRFVESSCLKCHHDVESLAASEKFPDPPAPKLTKGYELVRKFGCFGCHDIKGFAGPDKRIGPDMRIEPDYFVQGHLIDQALQPLLAAQQPAVETAREAEAKLAAQSTQLADRKTKPDVAKADADRIDQEIARLKTSLDEATKARITAQEPLNRLQAVAHLAAQVVAVPDDADARNKLRTLIAADADRAATIDRLTKRKAELATAAKPDDAAQAEIKSIDEQLATTKSYLPATLHEKGAKLADIETPGTLRKVGPSVRHIGGKLSAEFLADWIANPRRFRESTRMPHVFGNFDHLKDDPKSLEDAQRFEAVEIRGIVEYLLKYSEALTPAKAPAPTNGVLLEVKTDEQKKEQIERGRSLFATRGCLACHSIKDEGRPADAEDPVAKALLGAHADAKENQGPDLSKIGAKLKAGSAKGRDPFVWMVSRLREPTLYHARTKMPNLFLDPIEHRDAALKVIDAKDASGQPIPLTNAAGQPVRGTDGKPRNKPQLIDPAADIAAYLLSLDQGWSPQPLTDAKGDKFNKDLNDLAKLHLEKACRESLAKQYLAKGITDRKQEDLKGDEIELLAKPDASIDDLSRKKLLYVGRRAISKYGCFGCHDIPRFEDAKAIGTGLADWGRKETDKLAFEQIVQYMAKAHGHGGASNDGHGVQAEAGIAKSDEEKRKEDNRAFFHHELQHGSREGFLFQKLSAPRSYDFAMTATKGYNEWLRMPKFNLTDDEIEAVMTFVLGLVAEPPAPQYVYNPPPRQKAIVEGAKLLEKYNCGGCHVLQPERLVVRYMPGSTGQDDGFKAPDPFATFDFLRRPLTSAEAEASKKSDFQGKASAILYGLPAFAGDAPVEYRMNPDGTPYEPDPSEPPPTNLKRPFMLWKNAVIDGQVHYVGSKEVGVPESAIDKAHSRPAVGGDLPRLMMPILFQPFKSKLNLTTWNGNTAWTLAPPPLIGEGRKVQSAWLTDFLLNPFEIRPAVQLRMPRFNMSRHEAESIAAYFAAVDGVPFPYSHTSNPAESGSSQQAGHRSQALQLVVAGICKDCHRIGDYAPGGHPATLAPQLGRVHDRLRPEFIKDWLAKPSALLPYTTMTENFPHGGLLYQQLYPGTSTEQIDAVVDLLLNYSQYMSGQIPIAPLVPKPATGAEAKPATGAGGK